MAPPTDITPGAQRSLDRAVSLAAGDNCSCIDASHLLWALWLEECNAAAILESLGVSREQLEQRIPVSSAANAAGADTAGMTDGILLEARWFLRMFDPFGGELTTEHLLLALTRTSPAELNAIGVAPEEIQAAICPRPDTSVVDVEPEYRLSSDTETEPRTIEPPRDPAPPVARPADDGSVVLRMIDAAANRTREGLRVVEDYTRFGLNDRLLTTELKRCRHDVSSTLRQLDSSLLVRSRETRQDVGTEVRTEVEYERPGSGELVTANMKRVQEGLRTLEEGMKLLGDPTAARRFEQARYKSYTLERAVTTCARSNRVFADRALYLLVTESICRHGWQQVVIDALDSGVRVVQLREKQLPDAELIRRGQWLREVTRQAGALFVMNDRPDLAMRTDADGVHLGQSDLSVAAARRELGADKLIGVSTHSLEQAREAVLDGADYLGVGPVFHTSTKDFDELAGLRYVAEVTAHIGLPWFAIGGIDGTNLPDVLNAGAARIAVSSSICGAKSVESETTCIALALKR